MLLDILSIEPILKTMTEEECEVAESNNRHLWNSISRELNTVEMECEDCGKPHLDVKELLFHEAECLGKSPDDAVTAYEALKKKGNLNMRNKFEFHQCHLCDKVFKNKYLLQQHQTRGKNPKGCLKIKINHWIKEMSFDTMLELKQLMKSELNLF